MVPCLLNTDEDDAVTLNPGTRVQRTDTHVHGVVKHGGTLLRRLVALDDGSTEYVHVDYLKASTEPIIDRHADAAPVDVVVTVPKGSNLSDLEAASETPDDDAPVIELAPEPIVRVVAGWTKQGVIDRMHEWQERFGEPPASTDWTPRLARKYGREDVAALVEAERDHWPHPHVVIKLFGSWSRGLEAAGYQPRWGGRRPRVKLTDTADEPDTRAAGSLTPHELDLIAEFEAQLEDDLEFQSPPGTVDEKWLAAMPLLNAAIEPLTHDEAIHMAERHDAQAELFRAIARVKAAA